MVDERKIVMKTAAPGASNGELVAHHTTSVSRDLITDTIEIVLMLDDQEPEIVWKKSQRISKKRPYGALSNRLLLYDLVADDTTIWILYSACRIQGSLGQIYIDRMGVDDDGTYKLKARVPVLQQNESSTPRLMSSGMFVQHDAVLYLGFRSLRETHRIHGRQPYEFWKVEGQSAVPVEDEDLLESLLAKSREALDSLQSRQELQTRPPPGINEEAEDK